MPNYHHIFPQSSDAEIWNTAPRAKLGDDFTLLTSRNTVVQKGEELYLNYGAHSNRTLFVEYGFVNEISEEGLFGGKFSGEVDVQDIIEEMFRRRGTVGEWMKGVLKEEGYWEYVLNVRPTS